MPRKSLKRETPAELRRLALEGRLIESGWQDFFDSVAPPLPTGTDAQTRSTIISALRAFFYAGAMRASSPFVDDEEQGELAEAIQKEVFTGLDLKRLLRPQ